MKIRIKGDSVRLRLMRSEVALFGDQPGDFGSGIGHMEGQTKGPAEGRQLGRQQGADAFLQGVDGGKSRGIRGRGSRELCSHRLSRRALGGWPLRPQRGAAHLAAG